jgi:hypothetical protein
MVVLEEYKRYLLKRSESDTFGTNNKPEER